VGNCSPLLCIPSDHSYTAEVELLLKVYATGGLILFFITTIIVSGILANNENVLG